MTTTPKTTPDKAQSEKFADLARELEADEDEAVFDAKLREVASTSRYRRSRAVRTRASRPR